MEGLKGLSTMEGDIPQGMNILRKTGERIDIQIEFEFVGDAFADAQGNRIPKNTPYRFYYKKFFQPIDFTIHWFDFDSLNNPLKTGELFPKNAKVHPFKTEKANQLAYAWWGGIKEKGLHEQFITIAEGEAAMQAGNYEIGITWDDAVRVYIDNKLLIDEWHPLESDYDESPHKRMEVQLNEGKHQFRVEHIELGGMATLALTVHKLN